MRRSMSYLLSAFQPTPRNSSKFQHAWSIDHPAVLYRPAYSKKDSSGTEIAFTPNQRVPNLKKLDMGNEIESMKITCGP